MGWDVHKLESYSTHARHITLPSGFAKFSPAFFIVSDMLALILVMPNVVGQGVAGVGLAELKFAFASALIVWAMSHGHYTKRLTMLSETGHLIQAISLIALVDAVGSYYLTGEWALRHLLANWLPVLSALVVARQIARRLLIAGGLWQMPVLVVSRGGGDTLTAALGAGTSLGYKVAGVLDLSGARTDGMADLEARITALCDDGDIQMAVLDLDALRGADGKRVVKILRARKIGVAFAPSLAEMPVLGVQAQSFFCHDVVLLTSGPGIGQTAMYGAKRLLDIVVASLLLVPLAPVLAVVAVAVKASGGPLLFGHQRVGHNGRSFRCWKFRTMVPNAEAVLQQVLAADPERAEEWRQNLKLRNDPRVTAIGGFLRRSSLDELPQLFNVLCGDMSLIGPRPVTKGELERYGEEKDYYLAVRPGITGLWQVLGRNDTSYGQRVLLDAWYVRNWSLWHDLLILLKTVPVVLRGSGAY